MIAGAALRLSTSSADNLNMETAALIFAAIAIYVIGGSAAWWVNQRIDLNAVTSRPVRASLRVCVVVITFAVVTIPLSYGLEPFFG
jgi:uncharacterized membrane protein YwzB